VFGDGTVETYYPPYMKRAGTWRGHLSAADLDALVTRVVGTGVLDFEAANAYPLQQQNKGQDEAKTFTVAAVSDSEWVEIRLNLLMTTKSGLAPLERVIRWKDLHWDRRQFPESEELKKLAHAVLYVRQVADDPGYYKVAP
jgi:hypothetical protein